MDTLLNDLKQGIRSLLKHRGFTAVALLTLAIGIGANTAIFSLVNAVLIKPLQYPEADRLAIIFEDLSSTGFPRSEVAAGNYFDWKSQQSVFDDMALVAGRSFNLTGEGEPEKVSTYAVTANFFALLGVKPSLGRDFTSEDDKPGAAHVVILSDALWNRRFGGQREIVGREILLNGEKYMVIGVMPRGFKFLQSYVGLWVPAALTQEQLADRDSHYMTAIARLKHGVTFQQAHTNVQMISDRIARDHPDKAKDLKSAVIPLHEEVVGNVRRTLVLLVVAAGLVLLIACANIANLQLSRATERSKEIAIRVALGAGRMRIVRQLLVESILVGLAGGALGLLVAMWSFSLVKQLVPMGVETTENLKMDTDVLLYAAIVSLLTGIVFGLVPALQASRVNLNQTLKQGSDRGSSATGADRIRGAFVIAEVALSVVLLVASALMFQTVYNMRSQYAGLKPESLLTLRTVLPEYKYREHSKRVGFYDQVLEKVRALPGVVSAAYTTSVPLQWKGGFNSFTPEGVASSPAGYYTAIHRQVSSNYFQVTGSNLQQGRFLDEHDSVDSMRVAVINETMARQYWPNESPVGKRFKLGTGSSPWVSIVGVVNDVRQMGMDEAVKAEMYFPYRQILHFGYRPRDLVVRTSIDPTSLAGAISREIHKVDPDQPVSNVALMSDLLTEETGDRRVGLTLLMSFSAVALLLAILGIYGVLSYFVSQQTREIGVRVALGAQLSDILRLVLKKGMRLTLLGVGIGLIAAFLGTRLMATLLFGVSPTDGLTFMAIALLLLLVALIACLLPARRATKIDPLVALRYE